MLAVASGSLNIGLATLLRSLMLSVLSLNLFGVNMNVDVVSLCVLLVVVRAMDVMVLFPIRYLMIWSFRMTWMLFVCSSVRSVLHSCSFGMDGGGSGTLYMLCLMTLVIRC